MSKTIEIKPIEMYEDGDSELVKYNLFEALNEVGRLQQENEQLKKQKDDVVEYINKHCVNEKISKQVGYKCYTMADTNELEKIMRMLGEIDNE